MIFIGCKASTNLLYTGARENHYLFFAQSCLLYASFQRITAWK